MKNVLNTIAEKQGVILQVALGGIMALFIGILIAVYFISKAANPIILDESGKPLGSQPATETRSYR